MISGEAVCCSVAFDTLVGEFVFTVMWSELLLTISGLSEQFYDFIIMGAGVGFA